VSQFARSVGFFITCGCRFYVAFYETRHISWHWYLFTV